MIDATQAGSAFLIGLAGAGHCLGMCGGIAVALNLGKQRSIGMTLAYHSGRIVSYTLLGALAGFITGSIGTVAWTIGLRYLAGFLLIGMGLYIADWWRGMTLLERGGAFLWRPVQRLSSKLLPLRHWSGGLVLGLCWGVLPCGLIYSSLAWAATAQNWAHSASMMLLFGLGTLPAMLATSLGASQIHALLKTRNLKLVIGLLLIVAGFWTVYAASMHNGHGSSGHLHHTQNHTLPHPAKFAYTAAPSNTGITR